MKSLKLLFVFLLISTFTFAQKSSLTKEAQINLAVQAAPEADRAGAEVLGYDKEGNIVILREGTNHLVCLGDAPSAEGIHVACYAKELSAFMSRGREILAEGKSEMEKREIRKAEIDAGTLLMPKEPAIVYVLQANDEDLNVETGELAKSYTRYVLYKPYMTPESTGLPVRPAGPGVPWLMDSGTHRSHIMITPPRQ